MMVYSTRPNRNIGIFYVAYADQNDNILDTELSPDDFTVTVENAALLSQDIYQSDKG